jgi:hypothetical protein
MEYLDLDIVIYLLGLAAMWGDTRSRLSYIEKRVDAHNHFDQRVKNVETEVAVEKERIEVANHRISDLEEYHKPKGEHHDH